MERLCLSGRCWCELERARNPSVHLLDPSYPKEHLGESSAAFALQNSFYIRLPKLQGGFSYVWNLPWREFILKRKRYKGKKPNQTPKQQTINPPSTPPRSPLLQPPKDQPETKYLKHFKCKQPRLWGCRLHINTLRQYRPPIPARVTVTCRACCVFCCGFAGWAAVLWGSSGFLEQGERAGSVRRFPDSIPTAAGLSHGVRGVSTPVFSSSVCACTVGWWCWGKVQDLLVMEWPRAEQSWGSSWGRDSHGTVSRCGGDCSSWGLSQNASVCWAAWAAAVPPEQGQEWLWSEQNRASGTSMPRGWGWRSQVSEWDTEMTHKNKVLMGQALFFWVVSQCEVDESQALWDNCGSPGSHPRVGRGRRIELS